MRSLGTQTFTPEPVPRRSLVLGLTVFAAVSALLGGMQLLVWPAGNEFVPISLLSGTAFPSFLIPGLLLACVVAGTSAVAAILVWRRSALAIDATLLAGGALTIWIVAEVAQLRSFHWLHGLYGVLGLLILGLGLAAGWAAGPRLRWLIAVTLGEGLGFLAPVCVGVAAAEAGLGQLQQALLVVAAGVFEGLCLGAGQAIAMPAPVRRARYAALTGLGASVAWGAGMSIQAVGSVSTAAVTALVGVVAGLIALVALGGAQWLELRHHNMPARVWIGWTALAWVLALPMSALPAPLVDASTPGSTSLTLWACSGLMMAYVMATVTWRGAARLVRPAASPTLPAREQIGGV